MGELSGTNGLVVGVANKRSLAWATAKAADEAGASLTLSYATDRSCGTFTDSGSRGCQFADGFVAVT